MVSIYGLNKKIGHISFYDSSGNNEYAFTKPYSEKTAQMIDEEVTKMVEDAYLKTKEILKTHRAQLTELAQQLLDKEVIFKEDLERILGPRPFTAEIAEPASKRSTKYANGTLKNGEGKNETNGSPVTNITVEPPKETPVPTPPPATPASTTEADEGTFTAAKEDKKDEEEPQTQADDKAKTNPPTLF